MLANRLVRVVDKVFNVFVTLRPSWSSLEQPAVGLADLIRTGAFISTIGLLSGALAGGLENRKIIRDIALFMRKP